MYVFSLYCKYIACCVISFTVTNGVDNVIVHAQKRKSTINPRLFYTLLYQNFNLRVVFACESRQGVFIKKSNSKETKNNCSTKPCLAITCY